MIEQLKAQGHRVVAIDLPGQGNDSTLLNNQNLENYARFVANVLCQESNQVILLGHSLGGAIACQIAEYNPGKVKKLVILCGFLFNNGENVNGLKDGSEPSNWIKMVEEGLVYFSPDQKVSYWNLQKARKICYSDMSEEQAGIATFHMGGSAIAVHNQGIKLGKNFAVVPKIYIKTLKDIMLSPALQEKLIQRGVEKVYTINSGHFPFLTAPQELTAILLDIADNAGY